MRKSALAALCVLGVALTACSSSGSKSGGDSKSLTPVTVDFTYTWKGEYVGLVYADEKGLFAKEGLKVTFKEGKGSQVVYAGLGDGKNTFVIGPSGTAAQAASTGVPVISVATFIPITPSVLVAQPGVTLNNPKDLEGKKIGLRNGADAALFFNAFLSKNGVDASKVNVTKLDSSAANAAFLNGSIQVVDAFTNNEVPTLEASMGQKLHTLAFDKFGFTILGQGVAVTPAFLKSDPDTVRKFLKAEAAGIEAAKKDPAGAAKVMKDRVGTSLPDLSVVEAQVTATLDAMTAEDGHPLGWASPSAWQDMVSLFQQTGQIRNALPMDKYFTNDYVAK